MNILPFVSAAFLLGNPLLLAVFKRFEIQLEKLQFWVMVGSGSAWVFSAALFLLGPDSHIDPVWNAGETLLPNLAFSLDWVSAALSLGVCSALFFVVLARQDSPRGNALLSGMAGVTVLGVFADSAYSLALFWAGVEVFLFLLVDPREHGGSSSRDLLAILLRLAAPLLLVLESLTASATGIFTEWEPTGAYALLVGGLAGFSGWHLGRSRFRDPGHEDPADIFQAWIPSALGLGLMIRGGTLLGAGDSLSVVSISAAALLVLVGLGSALLDDARSWWFLGCGLLTAGSAALAEPASALSWALAFSLSGNLLWAEIDKPQPSYLLLGIGALGILPVPFLPVWVGLSVFEVGPAGILLAVGCGIFLGALVVAALKALSRAGRERDVLTPLNITAAASLLLSQVLIALRLGLLGSSRGLLSRPVLIWIAPVFVILSLMVGNWVPLRGKQGVTEILSLVAERLVKALGAVFQIFTAVTDWFADLLEGDGGLIWALLFGFLIISLISLGGGR